MAHENGKQLQRGSEWGKWDLHIHSLHTHLNNDYSGKNEKEFIQKIKDAGIQALGLTNYFKFSEDDFKLKKKLEKEGIVVFLNLELRLTYTNKDDKCCDLHIIFDNTVEEETIKTFLDNLETTNTNTKTKCSRLENSTDFNNAVVEFVSLLEKLEEESLQLKEKYLIGFLSRGKGTSRSSSVYEQIAKDSHFLIHSSDSEKNIGKDRDFWIKQGKPLLQGSDAHTLDDIGKKFTWIKADTTFEGLKQILYEPEERVRIQEENPSFEFDKPYFEKIKIQKEVKIFEDDEIKFETQEIPLHKDLVTIIGGRGTGKSLLINYIAKIFQKPDDEKYYKPNNDFIVSYKKENHEDSENSETYKKFENDLNFLFIEQSKIKKITEKDALKEEIKKFLKLEDLRFDEQLNTEIQQARKNIQEIETWFYETDEYGDKKNSKEYNEAIKTKHENLLTTISTEKNKENLKIYTSNIQEIHQLETAENYGDDFTQYLEQIKKELENKITKTNKFFNDEKELQIPNIADFFSKITDILGKQKKHLEKNIEEKQKENKNIKTNFEKSGYSGDLTTLLENVTNYKNTIEDANKKIKEIQEKKDILKKFKKKRKELGKKIFEEYKRQKKCYKDKWKDLSSEKSEYQKEMIKDIILTKDINFNAEIKFNTEKFYELIHNKVDKRKYRALESLKEPFNHIDNIDTWKSFFENDKFDEIFSNEDFSDFIGDIFFTLQTRSEYIKVLPELTYKNKSMDKLSAGQKGTLYLRLQLATNAFSTPIIFDQPEDDLDNEFIMNELVKLFKKLKKYRQIILVTHNANIVISADAEEVIIAENVNETLLRYKSGAIENKEIKESICNILEGGKKAFEIRRNKYNF